MKIKPEDHEQIGNEFTRGLGQGCGAVLGLGAVVGIVLSIYAIVGWLL